MSTIYDEFLDSFGSAIIVRASPNDNGTVDVVCSAPNQYGLVRHTVPALNADKLDRLIAALTTARSTL